MASSYGCYRYTAMVFAALTFVELVTIICLLNHRVHRFLAQDTVEMLPDKPQKTSSITVRQVQIAARNRPFAEKYRDARKAFPRSSQVDFKKWSPRPDSYQYFQPMDNQDAWVYSSFWDTTKAKVGQPTLVSIGIARRPLPWRIFCHFHPETPKTKFVMKPGSMQEFWESHNTSVVPFIMKCRIPKGRTPKRVSFTFNSKSNNMTMTNSLQIQYPGPRLRQFTVCYSALHSAYNDTSRLVQSIAFNRILGAEHFIFYNFSISRETDSILRYYVAQGLATVHQWPLPTAEAWYLGQVAIINDCVYRNINVSEFAVFVDTDELIVPRLHNSWSEMIKAIEGSQSMEDSDWKPSSNSKSKSTKSVMGRKYLNSSDDDFQSNGHNNLYNNTLKLTSDSGTTNKQKGTGKLHHLRPGERKTLRNEEKIPAPPSRNQANDSSTFKDDFSGNRIGSFLFKNAFFPSKLKQTGDWAKVKRDFSISKDEEHFLKRFGVLPITDYNRSDPFPNRVRSKIIVRPELVERVGIHYVFRHVTGARSAYVREDVALVHHYRPFNNGRHLTADLNALRFKQPFLNVLEEEFVKLKHLI